MNTILNIIIEERQGYFYEIDKMNNFLIFETLLPSKSNSLKYKEIIFALKKAKVDII